MDASGGRETNREQACDTLLPRQATFARLPTQLFFETAAFPKATGRRSLEAALTTVWMARDNNKEGSLL